jgi:hypothetical protein
MTKKELIETIEMLYPADAHAVGERLLWQSICMNWRELPEKILQTYATKCIVTDRTGETN